MPLPEARKQYKPFEYPWAFEFRKRQQLIVVAGPVVLAAILVYFLYAWTPAR